MPLLIDRTFVFTACCPGCFIVWIVLNVIILLRVRNAYRKSVPTVIDYKEKND